MNQGKEYFKEYYQKHKRERKDYQIWWQVNTRCYNPKSRAYKWYGARGFTNYWRTDRHGFIAYISKLKHYGEDGYSLDRINNDLGYQPGNLRWATDKEQQQNRRPSAEWAYREESNRVGRITR